MVNNCLLNKLRKVICSVSIQLWHILCSFAILIIILVLGLIPFYLLNRQVNVNNTEDKVRTYNAIFRVRWFNGSPDTFERSILSINDEFVAPRIIVEKGDIINVTLINESSDCTSIHWHGLYQENTLHMDGVPGITQCSILPNESFIYKYSTKNQSGSYWYHSHSAVQYGDGLKGILIIKDPQDPWKHLYDDEEIVHLTDWYHIPVKIHLKSYLYPGTLDPIPDTALINGIGQFNCSLNNKCSYYRASIRSGLTKRFRIINTSIYARITLTIDQHLMRLIEADGIYLDGNKYLQTIRLSPGQRYSVLVTAKLNISSNYWIRATIHPFVDYNGRYNRSIQPDVYAILEYNNNTQIPSLDSLNNTDNLLNESIISGEIFSDEIGLVPMINSKSFLRINENIKTFILNSQFRGSEPGSFYFNNQTFIHPINVTLLSSILYNYSFDLSFSSIIHIESNEIIDVIINNIDYTSHPFHLHGHHVWILAQGKTGDGYLNQSTYNSIKYNIINPIYRDTFTVNPFSYIIFRFKANNPGIWMMHCHNDWHLQLGMAFIFIESQDKIKAYYYNNHLTKNVPSQCYQH